MAQQSRLVVGMALAILIALLVVFAVGLADSQSHARDEVEQRFRDRAEVSAALTEALFSSTTTSGQAENARRYGGARISTRTLDREADRSRNDFLAVLSEDGK